MPAHESTPAETKIPTINTSFPLQVMTNTGARRTAASRKRRDGIGPGLEECTDGVFFEEPFPYVHVSGRLYHDPHGNEGQGRDAREEHDGRAGPESRAVMGLLFFRPDGTGYDKQILPSCRS